MYFKSQWKNPEERLKYLVGLYNDKNGAMITEILIRDLKCWRDEINNIIDKNPGLPIPLLNDYKLS